MSTAVPLKCGQKDMYNCITVKVDDNGDITTAEQLKESLSLSIVKWIEDGIRGVWVHIPLSKSFWIAPLAMNEFCYHHAQPDYVMMTRWFAIQQPNNLPGYPFTQIGVGGFVVNKIGQILLVREKNGPFRGWKIPGGLANPEEEIYQSTMREVLEETGIETEKVALLGFRHVLNVKFKICGDIFFVFLMKPKDESHIVPKCCEVEIAECQWFDRSSIDALQKEEIGYITRYALEMYDRYKQEYMAIYPEDVMGKVATNTVYSAKRIIQ